MAVHLRLLAKDHGPLRELVASWSTSSNRNRHEEAKNLAENKGMPPALEVGSRSPSLQSALQLVGKLKALVRQNAGTARKLVHITDQMTGRHYLVDTGTSFSWVPHQSKGPTEGPSLISPSGAPIKCWGETTFQLPFSDRTFRWS